MTQLESRCTSTAYIRLIDALRDAGKSVVDNGPKAQAQCPAHDDGQASLSVTGIDGQVLVYCHAGCQTAQVVHSLGLQLADLFDNPRGATYNYGDGRRVLRSPEKKFWQSGNTKGSTLYRVERVAAAETVYVAEGEKDVHALESVGAVAVCSAMGAGKADKFDWSPLAGKRVTIIADRDEPGRKHAAQVAALLADVAASTCICEAAVGKDAADHIAAGKALNDFVVAGGSPGTNVTPGNGCALLDEVETFLCRFVSYPSAHAPVAHVLWIAHTYFMDAWESTPRIAFLSPEPGSGKSRALEVMEPLVPLPVHAVNTTPAYLFRNVSDEAGRPTILYDEIDTVFGPKAKDNEDIRGMLNAGHRKGATAGRCVMRGKVVETEELPAYCAVALVS